MTSSAHGALPAPAAARFRDVAVGWRGWHLRIRRLPLAVCDTSAVLQDLRAFRAEILFAAGRRPAFRDFEGHFVDAHMLDHGAYHVTAHPEPSAPPSGYIRLAPPALTGHFQTRAFLGDDRFLSVLEADGMPERAVFEHARMVVAEHARGVGLGVLLNAAAIATARALGAAGMVGICGMDDGQHQLQQRFGFIICPGTEHYSAHYQDHVCAIVHRTDDRNGEYEDLVHQLHQRITFAISEPARNSGTGVSGTVVAPRR
ncbi:hypothetical protein ABZT03_43285 [Streptomyces sp. NPDC005574]|uniref:hypothetical protein n=1 Tax=Streptomyces sp. NPDC005574 TaxID=3156891 RepID=UPI0033AF580A